MSLESSENNFIYEVGTPASERFQTVATLSVALGRFPHVDGIFDNNICVVKDLSRVPDSLVSEEYPRLNREIVRYFGLIPNPSSSPLTGIKYINLTEDNKYKGKLLKALKKTLGLKISSLENLMENMGVDGIGPSTTAL